MLYLETKVYSLNTLYRSVKQFDTSLQNAENLHNAPLIQPLLGFIPYLTLQLKSFLYTVPITVWNRL